MMEQRNSIINLHDSSKRLKDNSALVDSISGLPDSILGLVLSFLPTTEAVATSILSKRWKSVWVTVNNLDFYYEGCAKDDVKGMNFVRFVDRVLSLHDAGLLKFSLASIYYCLSSYASPWISTAIAKNVHDLSLSGEIYLPASVFSCDSLQSLELDGLIYVPTAFVVCLPKLERLKLAEVDFNSEEVFEKLISGCPMLNYLTLSIAREDDDGFTYIISSTSLRRVKLFFEYNCSVKLKASSLEYLKVDGCIPEIFEQKSLSTLVEAYFCILLLDEEFYQADICDSIVKVVRAFDCAKVVSLSAHVMRALSRATISLSTEFKRLVKLEAGIYCSSLRDFIQSSGNLEDLAINQLTKSRYESNIHDHSEWINPVEVPRCLSNSLKKVQLKGYKGLEHEREMIRYLLKHGSALEVMKIICDENKKSQEFQFVQEICGFSRKSPVCEVQFSGGSRERRYKLL